jgi:spore coat polysaccharide biosynthesis protein SpsF
MKKAIFMTVRTGSTRLPNKALLEMNGKPTIEHLIQRVKRSKKAELIVLCTTDLPEDKVLCKIAERNGIKYFQGSEKDKLERWNGAARKYDVEFFVTADGDDLFCEPELIDLAFGQYERTGADFIEGGPELICGSFTYAIKAAALKKVCEIKDSNDTEMMWVYFTDTGLFKTEKLQNVPSLFIRPEIRMTLDYEEDFKFFKTIMDHFAGRQDFSLREIVAFLDEHPEVIKINQYRQQEFLANQKKKTKLVIKQGVA